MLNENLNLTPFRNMAPSTTMSVDNAAGLPRYDFMTATEVSTFLGIGLTQSYEICKKINAKLSEQGYLTFRGKVPRQALLAQLPPQGNS